MMNQFMDGFPIATKALILLSVLTITGETISQIDSKCSLRATCGNQLNRTRELDIGASNKLSCYCDQKCADYDDCCEDSKWTQPVEERARVGAPKLRQIRQQWHCQRINPIFGDILVKASCRNDWLIKNDHISGFKHSARELIKSRCDYMRDIRSPHSDDLPKWLLTDPIGSMMPITDTLTGITYANSYCLQCNDVRLHQQRQQQQQRSKPHLIYWSPLLECNYNLDNDDRNTLYDLINTKKGQALRYVSDKKRWIINSDANNNGTTESNGRVCSINPTPPDSVEPFIRYCRQDTIDTCPTNNNTSLEDQESQLKLQYDCYYGHQSLVFGQNSDLVYFNLACARCHHEKQVLCDPKLKKQMILRINSVTTNMNDTLIDPQETIMGSGAGRSNSLGGIDSSGSFSVLLDLHGSQGGDGQVGQVHQCPDMESQVFDPILMTCRDIICGLNHRFIDGRCEDEPMDRLPPGSSSSISSSYELDHEDKATTTTTSATTTTTTTTTTATPKVVTSEASSTSRLVQHQVASFELNQHSHSHHHLNASKLTASEPPESWPPSELLNKTISDLPQPSAESRRLFTECGKILISREHYRLFTWRNNQFSEIPTGNSDQATSHSNTTTQSTRKVSMDGQVWAYVLPYNLTVPSSEFELVRQPRKAAQLQATSHIGELKQQVVATGDEDFKLLVCSPFKSDLVDKFNPIMAYLTIVCLVVSIASLSCYLLLYCLSTFDMRHLVVEMAQAGQAENMLHNNPLDKCRGSKASNDPSIGGGSATRGSHSLSSRGVACLAGALLAAYTLFIAGHNYQQHPAGCVAIATSTYYFFLLAFNWMFLLSYDIWRTLRLATCQLRGPAMHSQTIRFLVYSIMAMFVALLITSAALAVDLVDPKACSGSTEHKNSNCSELEAKIESFVHLYRPKFGQRAGSCWFANRRSLALFFGLPVTLIMLVNLLFFLHSSYMVINTSSRSSRRVAKKNTSSQSKQQQHQSDKRSEPEAHIGLEQNQLCDYTQQNSLTTSSMSSVQTTMSTISQVSSISSSRSLSSSCSSSSDRDEEDDKDLVPASPTQIQTDTSPGGEQQRQQQLELASAAILTTGEASRELGRRHATNHHRNLKLISQQSQSQSSLQTNNSYGGVSVAASLINKCDSHMQSLSCLMSSILKDYKLYCRLSTIMGLTWLTGLMASIVDQSDLLWYLFVVLNTLQGLFIFIAFGCKQSKLANLFILVDYLRFKMKPRATSPP